MIKEEQAVETNKLIKKMQEINGMITFGVIGGDYDKALKWIEQEEELLKHFQGDIPEEIKELHLRWLFTRGIIYVHRGDLAHSFKDANELLTVARLYDHKRGISNGMYALGSYYRLSGDLDEALVHYDRAIRLREENLNDLWDFRMLAVGLSIALGKGSSRVMKMERISEGEVTPYKGSQPCLVCKGSAEGF